MQPDYAQPVADYPRFHAAHIPDKVAYVDGDSICSYAVLEQRSNRIANALIASGCTAGDRIAYLGINSGAYVEVFFGANKAKVVYVGLNWRLAPLELEYVINDAGASIVFCDEQYVTMLEGISAVVPSLEKIISVNSSSFCAWRDSFSDTDPSLGHEAEDPIIQFYTSGTTGKPKGVVISNKAMSEHRWAEDQLGDWYVSSGCDEVSINAMPNFHIGGLGWLLIGLFRGAKVILMGAPDAKLFLDLIEQEKVTHLFAVPVVLGMMLEEQKRKPRDLSSLKVFHYGASPIAPTMLREAIQLMSCGFCQYYGMTEANGSITVLSPEFHQPDNFELLKSCGKALPGVTIKICDAQGHELPTNCVGEVWVRTDALMLEYWRKPEASAEVISDGWYKSGDGARIDEKGFVYISDRIKDMIVSGGENIYPAEVENALYEYPGVEDVAVIGIPDKKWGESLKAVLVVASNVEVTDSEFISFLRDRLAGYKIPRVYQFVDALPRTASGKLQKYKLHDLEH